MDNTTPTLDMNDDASLRKPSLFDELVDFINELWEMIKEDFRNSIHFISSNRSYFYTVAFLAVLLQFSSVNNLGGAFEKYCNKHLSLGDMKGGGGEGLNVQSYQAIQQAKMADAITAKADKRKEAKQKKLDAEIKAEIKKKAGKLSDKIQKASVSNTGYKSDAQSRAEAEHQIGQDVTKKAQDKHQRKMMLSAKKESIKEFEAKESEKHEQDKLMKANKERLSFFENIKGKIKGLTPSSGPLFSNLDLIFSSVKDIFYIVLGILVIVGVLSLPVLVFLIFTYYVFKIMISKFVIL